MTFDDAMFIVYGTKRPAQRKRKTLDQLTDDVIVAADEVQSHSAMDDNPAYMVVETQYIVALENALSAFQERENEMGRV